MADTSVNPSPRRAAWLALLAELPRRAAWIAVLATFPIFLIGGTVTTLRVGMAVPDWPTTFGQNMFAYPLEEMLASTGVFWEHSHRLWGAFVGLCVVALLLVVLVGERRAIVRRLAFLALVGVIAQGVLGGLRVTENSPQLAFLHGSLAQALFALLAAILFLESPTYVAARERAVADGAKLRALAAVSVAIVYAQIVLGAWLRHSGAPVAQALHVAFALATAAIALRLAGALRGSGLPELARVARWLRALVATQMALGVLAWIAVYVLTGPHNPVGVGEAVFATAHVACGALLLGACVAAFVYTRRCVAPAGRATRADGLEAAR